MTTRTRTAAAIGAAALLAFSVAGSAFAKPGDTTAAQSPNTLSVLAPVKTSAQDTGTSKPKTEGWQTGAGDMSDADCQGFANQIEEANHAAGEDFDSGDFESGFSNLELGENLEDVATSMGCAIKYPA